MPRLDFSKRLDVAIFAAMTVVLLSLLALLASNLAFQYLNYRDGIRLALADSQYIDHASILTYSRAWDFAVAKTSALFLSFLLVFTGAIYVLRTGDITYALGVEKGDAKASLSASSPGIIMLTLGVFLVAFVVSNKTYVEYVRKGLSERSPIGVKLPTTERTSAAAASPESPELTERTTK